MPTRLEPTLVTETVSLPAKLARIANAVGRIEKKGFNAFHKYQFVRETDLVDAMRPLLAEQGIWLQQTVSSHDKTGDLTIITVDFTWIDGTSGQMLGPVTFMGYGADTGDKGAAKALTAALKSFLLKTFMLGTGDDPEADENTDKRAEAKGASRAPAIKPGAAVGIGKGGKAVDASDTQVREVIRLAKEAGINGADLAVVTSKVLNTKIDLSGPDPRGTMLAFLKGLSTQEAGQVILALSSLKEEMNDDVLGDEADEMSDLGPEDVGAK